MSGDFDALFDIFTHSAYRLECLPAYEVSREDPALRAFRDGTTRPERSVRTSPWMRRVAVTTAAGKVWSRTRVIDTPLTEYQRFELPAYLESLAVGDSTSLVERAAVGDIGPDFWLFDAGTDHARAAVMQYSTSGGFLGYEIVTDPDRISDLERRRDVAQSSAVPILAYIASGPDTAAHG